MLSYRPWGVGNREIGSRARQYSRLPISQLPAHVAKLRPGLNATTHAVFGVAALAGAALLTGTEPPAYAYPVAVAAAWLPDVDNPRSTLGNGLSRLESPALNTITRPLSWALRTTSFTLVRTVGHRTLTHSLLGVVLFALLARLLVGGFPNLFLALIAGYASHVFADALNTRGVLLLWPLGRPFRLLPGGIRSGGVVEFGVALGVFAFALGELYLLHPALRGALL
jgi:inner membrane protein